MAAERAGLGQFARTRTSVQFSTMFRRCASPAAPRRNVVCGENVVTAELRDLTNHFFAATRALACHTGSLQERLADAYADHLLQVVASELPTELQAVFREVEEQMTAVVDDSSDDPIRAAAQQLSDDQARAMIEGIVALFGRLAARSSAAH